ncbi:MAG: hypothetical protein ACR2NH_02240 [Solirubrobacteraceae bacterium]
MKRSLGVITLLVLVAALPAPASAARLPAPPVITGVAPVKLEVGQILTIRGRNFVPGRLRNTVAFQRVRQRAVFVRADAATRTVMRVRIPSKLTPFLQTRAGKPVLTRFALRVLSRRFSRAFTRGRLAPYIGPQRRVTTVPSVAGDCDRDGVPNSRETDSDNDLLSDGLEAQLALDGCKPDSDGDTVEDGYEHQSALDINRRALPDPGKRPFPNPLDPSDAGVDHDGDGLTLAEEYGAWARYGGHALPLLYSAGLQFSVNGPTGESVPAADPQLDVDGSGALSDDERDADGDGLTNHWETHGPMTQGYWATFWEAEKQYPVRWPQPDYLDRDSDGDGLRDGDDDQDADDVSNITESIRRREGGTWVQPFNSCLPDFQSRTCTRYLPPCDQAWAPFRCDDVRDPVLDRPFLRWDRSFI